MNAENDTILSLLHEVIRQFCCAWGMKQNSTDAVISKTCSSKGYGGRVLLGLQVDIKDNLKKYDCRQSI